MGSGLYQWNTFCFVDEFVPDGFWWRTFFRAQQHSTSEGRHIAELLHSWSFHFAASLFHLLLSTLYNLEITCNFKTQPIPRCPDAWVVQDSVNGNVNIAVECYWYRKDIFFRAFGENLYLKWLNCGEFCLEFSIWGGNNFYLNCLGKDAAFLEFSPAEWLLHLVYHSTTLPPNGRITSVNKPKGFTLIGDVREVQNES